MKTLARLLALPALVLLAAAPARAAGRDHDPRLLLALSAYHQDPAPGALDFLAEERVPALLAVAADGEVPRLARVRAISLLAREEDPAALALVRAAATDPAWPVRLRIAAVRALANYRLEGEETLATLGAALGDPDPGVRKIAVLGLARLGTEAARARLHALRMRERHAAVRAALRRALEIERGVGRLPPEGRLRAVSSERERREEVRR